MKKRWAAAVLAVLVFAPTAAAGRVRLTVAPARSFADEAVHIKVVGLRPGASAAVTLKMRDVRGKLWFTGGRFRADRRGRIDFDRARPLSGSPYSGAWGMGLFASLTADVSNPYLFRWKASGTHAFRLGVRVGGRRVASRVFHRGMPGPVTERPLATSDYGFVGRYYAPPLGPSHTAVLVFGGSEGGVVFPPLPRMLAARGFPTLGIGYFAAPGVPPTLANIPLEYFERALLWLKSQPGVDPNKVVVLGVSRGSEAAQLLGTRYPNLVSGVVAAVPSNVALCGFPDCSFPAWTLSGNPVPFTREFDNPYPTDDPTAAIPDEQIQGPVFLVCGRQDTIWVSCPFQRAILDRLAAHGHPFGDVSRMYGAAGHGVGVLLPYLGLAPGGHSSDVGDERAREDVWPRLLSFLSRL